MRLSLKCSPASVTPTNAGNLIPPMCESDPLVCRCLQVCRSQIIDCIAVTGAETVREVGSHTGAGRGCLACHCRIKELLKARTAATAAAGETASVLSRRN